MIKTHVQYINSGKNKSTFANHAVTDGFSVSLTFARWTRRHDLEYVDLDLEDFGMEEVEAWFRPCALDPGVKQAFVAAYGAGQEQHEQRRVATREYYAQTGSAGRNRAQRREKERAGSHISSKSCPQAKPLTTINIAHASNMSWKTWNLFLTSTTLPAPASISITTKEDNERKKSLPMCW